MALSAQTPRQPPPATLADFLAIPAADRWHEFVDGKIIERAMPISDHGYAQGKLRVLLDAYDGPEDPEGKSRYLGGWWLVIDSEVDFPRFGRRFRPDLAGWRRETLPGPPAPIEAQRPDWVCEIISPEKRTYDTVEKRTYYAEAGIPYYWLIDYERGTLTALKLGSGRYLVIGEGGRGDNLHLAPFDGAEIPISRLFLR
jgi:Uma2 family endonuclease